LYFFALSNSLYFALPITPFTPDSYAIARHSLTVSIPSLQHPIIHFQPVDFGIPLSSFTSLTTKKTSDKTQFSISTILSGLAATAAAFLTEMVLQKRDIISATPHVEYSLSVGVLGCKINTNRVAYWPVSVGCENMSVKVSHRGRSLHLLHVDQSGGAYDMSYDAWNTLVTGKNATVDPTLGGGVDMEYESIDMDECSHLLHDSDGKLTFSAANSMNFIASCISEPNS
jgi:hypothetical protein